MYRPLFFLAAMAAPLAAADLPAEVAPAPVDVRASVMRMLEAARHGAPEVDEAPAGAEEDVQPVDVRANVMRMLREPDDAPAAAAPDSPLGTAAPPNPDERSLRRLRRAEERPDWYEGSVRLVPPENEAEARGAYVPLPHKSITVHSLDDLRQLRDEFEAGRRRGGAGASP